MTVTLQWNGVPPIDENENIFSRVRLTFDPSFFSDDSPTPDAWVDSGEVEDNYVPGGTVPVTISYVHSERHGDDVTFMWQTSTETGNAGFNILVETPEGLVQINSDLIASKVIDSVEVTDYEVTLATTATFFYIQEVAIDGSMDMIGPFEIGRDYGSRTDTGGTDPGETDPGETDPGETDPGETDPGETDPGETEQDNTIFLPMVSNTAVGASNLGESVELDSLSEAAAASEVVAEEEAAPEVVAEEEAAPEVVVEEEALPEAVAEEEAAPEVVVESEASPEVVAEEEAAPEVVAEAEASPEVVAEEEAAPEVVVEEEAAPEVVVEEEAPLR